MENENKQIKASSWALGILFIISAIVLILFYCFGYGNTTYSNGKNLTDPANTGLLIIWLYTLVGLCIVSVLGFGIAAAFRNMKTKSSGQKRTGFAGWVFVFTFALIILSYFLASTKPVTLGDNSIVDTTWVLKLSDVCLYSIYGLVIVSVLCSVLSMLGVFKAKK